MFVEEEGEGGSQDGSDGRKSEPPAVFFSALKGINPLRKYITNFDVYENTVAVLRSTENKMYRVQQEAKKQQLTLMDTWNKQTVLNF